MHLYYVEKNHAPVFIFCFTNTYPFVGLIVAFIVILRVIYCSHAFALIMILTVLELIASGVGNLLQLY